MQRIVSVSAAPYDGYAFPEVLDSLASCGVSHVEPAFIVGYTEPFDEDAFTAERARRYVEWLNASGLHCYAFSSHIDLGRADAVEVFRRRMDFAAGVGAAVINTNASARPDSARFFRNVEALIPEAERLNLLICLENLGDGSDNLLSTAQDGIELIQRIGSPRVRLNYDAANTASHRPEDGAGGVNPADDAILALPYCGHVHIKDIRITADGYFFTPIGAGDIGCGRILEALAATALNLSIELPLRLHRGADALPRRRPQPVPRAEIEAAVRASLAFVRQHLIAR